MRVTVQPALARLFSVERMDLSARDTVFSLFPSHDQCEPRDAILTLVADQVKEFRRQQDRLTHGDCVRHIRGFQASIQSYREYFMFLRNRHACIRASRAVPPYWKPLQETHVIWRDHPMKFPEWTPQLALEDMQDTMCYSFIEWYQVYILKRSLVSGTHNRPTLVDLYIVSTSADHALVEMLVYFPQDRLERIDDNIVQVSDLENMFTVMKTHPFYAANIPLQSVTPPREPPQAARKKSNHSVRSHEEYSPIPFRDLKQVNLSVIHSDIARERTRHHSAASTASSTSSLSGDSTSFQDIGFDPTLEHWLSHGQPPLIRVNTDPASSHHMQQQQQQQPSADVQCQQGLQFHME